ncbi:hypothetical protein MKW94_014073 [Papaver nudicaule]|uniref:Uncharacterized protein n=1 Tax=Papaver nudicaule TaxID=74823 RepID=A0AA41VHT0_PAPNU|nr:hypothetical protein [Papaver nudicaule]
MPRKFYHGVLVLSGMLPNGAEINKQVQIGKLNVAAKARGERISTKRQPEGPKPSFMVEGATLETKHGY